MTHEEEEPLSAEQQEALDRLDRVPMSSHGVSVERVQRCYLGIDQEPMPFDESTIADMVQDIADTFRYGTEAFVLRAVANALRGKDTDHKLVLRQVKRGKWESPSERQEKIEQQIGWLIEVRNLEAEGWPTDAAVHQVANQNGLGVSTIYAGIKARLDWNKYVEEFSQLMHLKSKRTPSVKT